MKTQGLDMFRPFSVDHPQGVYINICIKRRLYVD